VFLQGPARCRQKTIENTCQYRVFLSKAKAMVNMVVFDFRSASTSVFTAFFAPLAIET
jgi:hypothetical protein